MVDTPASDFDPAADDTEPGDDAIETRRAAVAPGQHGQRLDKLLTTLAPEFSRSHLQALVEAGHVQVQGAVRTTPAQRLKAGWTVEVALVPPAHERAFAPEAIALDVVYEDADLLVLNKPAGLVVHPAAGNWSGTLLNGLLAHHPASATLPRAGIVHRLDKDTSGLLVVGKTLQSVTALVRAIAAREVQREYQALVHGRVPSQPFRIDAPLARDPQSRVKMAVVGSGKPAQTDVSRVALAEFDEGAVSAVRCKLHTGRTHQIRVHMATRGHALLSDALYGGRPGLGLTRQALHAARLGCAHPAGGQPMLFEAAPPADLARAWQQVIEASAKTP